MLDHVPLGYILLLTHLAHERSYPSMFSKMNFKIRSGVIFLVTTIVMTFKFEDILVVSFMVA
jgi:hypothetical protein